MNREHPPIKIWISSCLLGEKMRYDGGHKHDRLITDFLGRFLEFIPVCPEVKCCLGTPQEAMHLVGNPDDLRLLTIKIGIDHTRQLREWAVQKVRDLEKEGLHGFIFKFKSPSSGMERVKVYGEGRRVYHNGVGMFTRGKELPIDDLLDSYEKLLMEAMRLKPTIKRHVNVIQPMAGYLKKQLTAAEKQELH